MAGSRGRQHRNRSTSFPEDRAVRATVMLQPGEDVRRMYEELVVSMGVSGAEVLREALAELHRKRSSDRKQLKQAS